MSRNDISPENHEKTKDNLHENKRLINLKSKLVQI